MEAGLSSCEATSAVKAPQTYIDTLDVFLGSGKKAVKIPEINREDFVCLTMAAFCLDKPVDVLQKKGTYFLRRAEDAAA